MDPPLFLITTTHLHRLTWYWVSVFVRILSYEGIFDMTSADTVRPEQYQCSPLEGRIAHWKQRIAMRHTVCLFRSYVFETDRLETHLEL